MRNDMEMAKSLHDPSSASPARTGKRERSFELSLPALVKGLDAAGRKFEERSAVCGISAQEVSFRLKARLIIDSPGDGSSWTSPGRSSSRAPCAWSCPAPSSTSAYEEKNDRQQYVVVRLDRGFRLHPNSLPPA